MLRKRINIGNDYILRVKRHLLIIKPIVLFICFGMFLSEKIYSQTDNTNRIEKIKTKVSKKRLEKNLLGYWSFKYLTNSSGKIIDKHNLNIDTLSITEEIVRPDFIFKKNKEYLIINKEKDTVDRGTWSYDEKEKILNLKYKKPKYNFPIEKLTPELKKKLEESNRLRKIKGTYMEIHRISNNELVFIEHKPHNEFELKYNLRVYFKK